MPSNSITVPFMSSMTTTSDPYSHMGHREQKTTWRPDYIDPEASSANAYRQPPLHHRSPLGDRCRCHPWQLPRHYESRWLVNNSDVGQPPRRGETRRGGELTLRNKVGYYPLGTRSSIKVLYTKFNIKFEIWFQNDSHRTEPALEREPRWIMTKEGNNNVTCITH